MRYLTTIPLKLKTDNGEIDLQPGDTFIPKNEDALGELLAEDKVKPVPEVMAELYREMTDWLHQHTLAGDEIKETLPSLYADIQDSIDRLDATFIIEDIIAFRETLERIRLLYTEAMLRTDRKVAVKVYSEVLGCHLWVTTNTDEDMHTLRNQGVTEAIYSRDEVDKLKGISKDSLKAIHKIKEVFEKSRVEEVE